jgi:hypothetical protein
VSHKGTLYEQRLRRCRALGLAGCRAARSCPDDEADGQAVAAKKAEIETLYAG